MLRQKADDAIPDGDHPAFEFYRRVLDTAIDEAIVRFHQQTCSES